MQSNERTTAAAIIASQVRKWYFKQGINERSTRPSSRAPSRPLLLLAGTNTLDPLNFAAVTTYCNTCMHRSERASTMSFFGWLAYLGAASCLLPRPCLTYPHRPQQHRARDGVVSDPSEAAGTTKGA